MASGCSTNPAETETTTPGSTFQASVTEGTTAASPGPGTAAPRPTTTAGAPATADGRTATDEYVRPLGYDLRVANYGENETEVAVTVETGNESDAAVVFDRTVEVAHDSSKEFDLTFPAEGTYRVSASAAGQNATLDWELRTENPDSGASVVVTSDGELRVGLVAI